MYPMLQGDEGLLRNETKERLQSTLHRLDDSRAQKFSNALQKPFEKLSKGSLEALHLQYVMAITSITNSPHIRSPCSIDLELTHRVKDTEKYF